MAAKKFQIADFIKAQDVPTVGAELEQIEYISLELIDPDPDNFYSLDGVEELAANIETVGLQQPLRVRPGENNHLILVSGHRRRAACMMIRDGGNPMFDRGVPCIRERGDVSPEMQELRLIFANSATRVMTAAELSRQAERVEELLYRLQAQGYEFKGRMRDHVAQAVNTSKSRLSRLHAIRERLAPGLLEEFDGGRIGETVAYRLSQEETFVQRKLYAKLGPAVRGLTAYELEQVIDRVKHPLLQEQEPEEDDGAGACIDKLKSYVKGRTEEDRKFWKLINQMADGLIERSFRSGAGPNRKDNIDNLRVDLRSTGVWSDNEHWSGSNKGLAIGTNEAIMRSWTEAYDALAAVALTRYRESLQDRKNQRNVKLKEKPVPTVDTVPKWQAGTPPREGRYLCRVDMGDGGTHECTGEYRGGTWSVFNGPLYKGMTVIAWWPLPEKEA